MLVCAHISRVITFSAAYNIGLTRLFPFRFGNELAYLKLSPSYPQRFVHKLLITFDVGDPQRREIKRWRGFRQKPFSYNEGPTSSCHTFCWKARQKFDVPFF
jgi:hypothetical protein